MVSSDDDETYERSETGMAIRVAKIRAGRRMAEERRLRDLAKISNPPPPYEIAVNTAGHSLNLTGAATRLDPISGDREPTIDVREDPPNPSGDWRASSSHSIDDRDTPASGVSNRTGSLTGSSRWAESFSDGCRALWQSAKEHQESILTLTVVALSAGAMTLWLTSGHSARVSAGRRAALHTADWMSENGRTEVVVL